MTDVTEEAAPPANPSRWFGLGRSARHDAKMVENSFTLFLFGSSRRNFSPKKSNFHRAIFHALSASDEEMDRG